MSTQTIPALEVRQWLQPEWDEVKYVPAPPRGKPEPQFYIFSISAYTLRKLSGIYRRDPKKPPSEDMGIQRRHVPERSAEILRYLQNGFPLSRIDPKKLVDQSEIPSLRMPGWVPTAVVANILTAKDTRGPKGTRVKSSDLVSIKRGKSGHVEIGLPSGFESKEWLPMIHPIEIIDGQHRLWALEEPEEDEAQWTEDFRKKIKEIEIPVVAFHGLDTTWQAYLFYTINQLPKKIDPSLVFDLYPLLREQGWLERFEGPNIYRDSRAQDLVIVLWSHPESPWKDRIIRLGGRGRGHVTQASFIRSLTASFIRRWHEDDKRLGGFFGAPIKSHEMRINWGREQQAAFLIVAWDELRKAIVAGNAEWTEFLLEKYDAADAIIADLVEQTPEEKLEANRAKLFSGEDSLIAADQGVRGYMTVLNDLLVTGFKQGVFDVSGWNWTRKAKHTDDEVAISDAIRSLQKELPVLIKLIANIAKSVADFDWRMPNAISKNDTAYATQAQYRGSGGYGDLRRNLLLHLRDNAQKSVKDLAQSVIDTLGLDSEEED